MKFQILDYTRGIAALYVMCHHFLAWNMPEVDRISKYFGNIFAYGHFMVGVFIVLSGFSIGLSPAKSDPPTVDGGIWGFITRRSKRILPGYYFALLFSVIIDLVILKSPWNIGYFGNFISHLLLMHGWFPGYSSTINMALWSISVEWQIYIAFILLIFPIWRKFGVLAMLIASNFLWLLLIVVGRLWFGRSDFDSLCPWYSGLFSFGVYASHRFNRKYMSDINKVNNIIFYAIIFVIVYILLKKVKISENYVYSIKMTFIMDVVGGAFSCLVMYFFLLKESCGQLIGSRDNIFKKILKFLGKISYSLYLIHCPIMFILLRWCRDVYKVSGNVEYMLRLGAMPLIILMAYGFHVLFEYPRFLRKR
jgi:peptidoglycan/LPS O-acetylase OafA/YrhL